MWKRDCKIFGNLQLQLYWPVSPSVVTIASPPSLIKRSLVSLFVSNWPIGGSQSSRTTSDNLIHIFYCAENITYIMEKYYNICRIFPSVFTVSKLAWIMSWRIVVDRDYIVPQIDPSVPQPVVQSRRRPLLGPSPCWKRLLALSHLRHY